ncbi:MULTISPECIES: hypothetical protein [Methylobacterium]|uniref:hypothetical protein n=1 Tax=Methylobacterium TaxID=407 RepID=UPI001FE06CAD|nr:MULTISPECIES: hypothetical protein [Methylobacterium]MDR7039282.1 hypothetical protein [Methylobacterium sp. BE186]
MTIKAMKIHAMLAGLALLGAAPAVAQTAPGLSAPEATGTVIQQQPYTTGNRRDVIIAPGATGAETITTNSAAGGNANLPERAVPNGSAGGGSGSSNGGQ